MRKILLSDQECIDIYCLLSNEIKNTRYLINDLSRSNSELDNELIDLYTLDIECLEILKAKFYL